MTAPRWTESGKPVPYPDGYASLAEVARTCNDPASWLASPESVLHVLREKVEAPVLALDHRDEQRDGASERLAPLLAAVARQVLVELDQCAAQVSSEASRWFDDVASQLAPLVRHGRLLVRRVRAIVRGARR